MKKVIASLLVVSYLLLQSCVQNEIKITDQECLELQQNYREVNEMLRMQIQNYIGEMKQVERLYSQAERIKLFLPLAKKMESLTLPFEDTLEILKGDYYFNNQKETFTIDKINQNYLSQIKQLNHQEYWRLDSVISRVSLSSKLNDKLFSSFKKTKSKVIYQLLLCKLQQDAYIISKDYIEACNEMVVSGCDLGATFFNSYFVQNTTHLRKGEMLTIQSGINQSVADANPQLICDDQIIEGDSTGLVVYKKKINQKPGKYVLPITISFLRPDSRRDSMESEITYIVDE